MGSPPPIPSPKVRDRVRSAPGFSDVGRAVQRPERDDPGRGDTDQQPAVSKHLRVLERAGLIEQGRHAQWRPRRLRADPLRDVADWVGTYRPHWEERFDRLDAFLRELKDRQEQQEGTDDDRDQD